MKIIHVNMNLIRSDLKNGTKTPVCRIEDTETGEVKYALEVIHPNFKVVYMPDNPLKCGARLWIETDDDVELIGETTYKDIKNA